jgi:GT2 family glycosyltransferase
VIDGALTTAVRIVDLVNSAGVYLSQEGHAGDRGWETPDDGQFDVRRESFAACGAAIVFTRATLDRVGGFADRFFAYYEDVDWCWRARLAGLRVVYDPAAVVRHVRSGSSGGEADPRIRLLSGRNRMHALARNAPLSVVARQLGRLPSEGAQRQLVLAAAGRVSRGVLERVALRRRRALAPEEVWTSWAGKDEEWEDAGAAGPRVGLPPRLRFGD